MERIDGAFGIRVHRLRIVLARKTKHLVQHHRDRVSVPAIADGKIV